jgi:glycyl-tRNA synthetase beta subunit
VFALALQNLSPAGAPALLGPILEFVNRRFEVSLREEGFRHDAIRAVLSRIDADPYLAKRAIYELHAMLVQDDADGAETFKLATQAYLRCARIVAFAEKKGITIPAEVDRAALQDTEEKRLLEELQSIEREVEGLAYDARTPHTLYGAFAKLVPAITAFFDKVLVMAEDPVLRNNRLALVQRIVGVMSHTLALEELEGFRE